jgi:UDP-N-acetylglucosamine 2-epimerase (non-hydrolysing)
MKILNIVGARPNFMKIAPIMEAMNRHKGIQPLLVHTGQHYDKNMSGAFFEDLELPKPDIFLGVGSGTHAEQTAKVMIEFEKVLFKEHPDLVLVVGDVNSTIACALAAVKLHIPVAHVEAGLRSFDRKMPEEINRVLTDAISEYLFITEKDAEANLLKEGKSKKQIFFVGNVMIDTLLKHRRKADSSTILADLRLQPKAYALLTLHRPENVDAREKLINIIETLEEISTHIKIVFPVHPRTKQKMENFGFTQRNGFILTEPFGYLDFLKLMSEAKMVFTDSGGIQEETTILGVPCLTLRENTERPVTIKEGTNKLVGTNKKIIIESALSLLNNDREIAFTIPKFWDGKAAQRIVDFIIRIGNY